MKSVELKYPNNELMLQLNIPSEWSELTRQHLKKYASIIVRNPSFRTALAEMLFHLSGLTKKKFADLYPDYLNYCTEAVSFLFEKETEISFKKSHFKKWSFLNGPDDQLENFTMDQFFFSDSYLRAYARTKDKKHLQYLLGCCYTLPLVGFRKSLIESIGFFIYHLSSKSKRYAYFLNYYGLNTAYKSRFKKVFKKGGEGTRNKSFGVRGIIIEVASGDAPFGNFDQVRKANATNVITYMEKIEVKREEMELEIAKKKALNRNKNG